MEDRVIEDLQARLSYQEVSIDELTRHSLAQQKQIDLMTLQLEQLQVQMRQVAESVSQGDIVDAPPPHY